MGLLKDKIEASDFFLSIMIDIHKKFVKLSMEKSENFPGLLEQKSLSILIPIKRFVFVSDVDWWESGCSNTMRLELLRYLVSESYYAVGTSWVVSTLGFDQ